ncbi:TPA: phage scaffold protein, partial [Escherichia coli]|nr:phage scaffold protein [Escherichia coli]
DEQAAVKALGITEAEYLKMKQEQEK